MHPSKRTGSTHDATQPASTNAHMTCSSTLTSWNERYQMIPYLASQSDGSSQTARSSAPYAGWLRFPNRHARPNAACTDMAARRINMAGVCQAELLLIISAHENEGGLSA